MGFIASPLRLALSIGFGLVSFISLIALFKLPSVLDKIVTERSVLAQGTLAAKLFQTIPFAVLQNVYLFNITNEREFFAGAKPKLQEIGPYVFKLTLRKEMSWNDNKTLQFKEHHLFEFAPELSNGHLSDSVITVDPVYAVAQKLFGELPDWIKRIVGPLLKSRSVLFKHTVGEILYDGYSDPLAKIAHLFKPDLPVIDGRIGYLRALNNTDDGDMTVGTGYGSSESKRNIIVEWNRKDVIPYYGQECNQLWGTNGELFPSFDPLKPTKHIGVFQPVFCRPWKLHYNESKYEAGLDLVRYKSGRDFFSPSGDFAYDKCQQPGGWQQGIFDVSNCQHGFPALMSLPHFLGAEQCLEEVEGPEPDDLKHAFEMLLYPRLGIPIRPALRAQINVEIRRNFSAKNDTVDNKSLVYPVLWQEIVLAEADTDYLSSVIWWTIKVPRLGLCSLALLLCVLGFFFAGTFGKASLIGEDKYDEENQPVLLDVEEDEPIIRPGSSADQR